MNIQEVLKLKNGTIVQDTETKERYTWFMIIFIEGINI